jgi:hypothetical protein
MKLLHIYSDFDADEIEYLDINKTAIEDFNKEQQDYLLQIGMANVYNTIEDFITAFNNGFISDEGYLAIRKEN